MHTYLIAIVVALSSLSQSVFGSAFAKLDFGGEIYIEIPRNWTVLDENLRNHLNTSSEAITRLAGLPQSANDNVILVAANAYTTFRTPSSTLRLSVRRGQGASQSDMAQVARMPQAELQAALAPIAEQSQKAMLGIDGVMSATFLGSRVASNKTLYCMFFEFETVVPDGTKISQTYVCPYSTKTIKLSTSYRKSESAMFRPVIEQVWQSLNSK